MKESRAFRTHFEAMRRAERRLAEGIAREHGSPFIAHYDLPEDLKEDALGELALRLGGDPKQFSWLSRWFPCLCSWAVATSLATAYGEEGNANVYAPIANRLGVGSTIASTHRDEFNQAFRTACRTLGLSLPPKSENLRMVDDYLFQAGVSRNQLLVLARAFLRAEKTFGVPDSDDTRDVDLWEDRAVDFAPPGVTVLRRIIRDDSTGFHGTSYLHLRNQPHGSSTFETAFIKAIKSAKSGPTPSSGVARPHLEYEDGELRIGDPRGASALEVRISGYPRRLGGGRSLPLPTPWPTKFEWRTRSRAALEEWNWRTVFSGPNVILVFDADTGILKGELSPATPSRQLVPSGQIWLLSRQPFEIGQNHAHPIGHKAFVLWHESSAGFQVRLGDVDISVDVDLRPRLQVSGTRIVRRRNAWLLAGPVTYSIVGETAALSDNLELHIDHPAMDGTQREAVDLSEPDFGSAYLRLPDRGEFGMAKVSLHVRGQERALYRCRFWYWPSLRLLVNHRLFDAASIPENLSEANLSHIIRNKSGQLELCADEAYLHAYLCFEVGRRVIRFELPPPGESIAVRSSDGTERALRRGASLIVGNDYASSLIVRCRDPHAAILMKGTLIEQAFGQIGSWRASFAVLNEVGSDNRVRLIPSDAREDPRDLVRIVSEAEPKEFATHRIGQLHDIEAHFERPIKEVRIDAENVHTGEQFVEECSPGPMRYDEQSSRCLEVSTFVEDSTSIRIQVDGNNFDEGLWFVKFAVREEGRTNWMPMIDGYGQSYAVSVAPESTAEQLVNGEGADGNSEELGSTFLRLCRLIAVPIHRDCRKAATELLKIAWILFGETLAKQRGPTRDGDLLRACVIPPPATAPESWLPRQHPIEVAPELFGAPVEVLGQLASGDLDGYEGFELVEVVREVESLLDAAQQLEVSPGFLMSFENAIESQGNPHVHPGAFDFQLYRNFLQQFDDDGPLSLQHYRRSCERVADRCAIIAPDGVTGPMSKGVVGRATRVASYFDRHGRDYLPPPDDIDRECQFLDGAARMISGLARESRRGCADVFWRVLPADTRMVHEKARKQVGIALRLAPELLAFYLLLWELVERVQKP